MRGSIDASAKIEHIACDVTRYGELENALRGCDAVVHLAGIRGLGEHPGHVVHNSNVAGSYNVLCAAAELGIRRICMASSINAVAGGYNRRPRYRFFPLDEMHPTCNEDAYSLSKWLAEQQADSVARRHRHISVASLRFHMTVADRQAAMARADLLGGVLPRQLWGWSGYASVARACMLSLAADFRGHEVFLVVAPTTMMERPSLELREEYYPQVPVKGDLSGTRGFYDCSKAGRLLGWRHDETGSA